MEHAHTIGLLFSGSPPHHFGVEAINLSGTEGASEKLALFSLENKVHMKNAFASANLETFSPLIF